MFCFLLSAVLPITNHLIKFRKMIFLAGYFARKFLRMFQVLKILTRITPCNTDTSRISETAEALRCEAQDNGNINWDYDHAYFCDFIRSTLNAQSIFSDADKEEISLIMNFIKECGLYAQRYNNSKCTDENVDIEKLAYTEDNLYDIICDKIGRLQKENSRPIPYRANDRIKR